MPRLKETSLGSTTGWLTFAFAVLLGAASTAHAQSAAEMQREREESRQAILTDDPADQVANYRRSCMAGLAPGSIQKNRGYGAVTLPDASEYCVTAGMRMARDGILLQPYRDLLTSLGGAPNNEQTLPSDIASAVLKLKTDQVSIGNGKAAIVTPALALDAGFTVAYQRQPKPPSSLPEVAALKPVAERCLAQAEHDLGLCYSIGYMYGLRAINGLPVTD